MVHVSRYSTFHPLPILYITRSPPWCPLPLLDHHWWALSFCPIHVHQYQCPKPFILLCHLTHHKHEVIMFSLVPLWFSWYSSCDISFPTITRYWLLDVAWFRDVYDVRLHWYCSSLPPELVCRFWVSVLFSIFKSVTLTLSVSKVACFEVTLLRCEW